MVDFAGAEWVPNTHFFPNRLGYKPKWIIVHGTAGGTSAQSVANYFAQPSVQSSTHYVIGTDGHICQMVYEHDGAWGNGGISGPPGTGGDGVHHDSWWDPNLNPNLISISIEHCKPATDNSSQLTPAQQAASFDLIKDICQRNGIPMRAADAAGGITGHFSMDPVNRSRCPGPYPWDALFAYLKGNAMIDLHNPVVAGYFEQASPTAWRCKRNGFLVRDGMLAYYQQTGTTGLGGLTDLGLPTENEHPATDAAGKAIPGVAEQKFERGMLRYDAKHVLDAPPGAGDAYRCHMDSLYGLPAALVILQQQVSDSVKQMADAKAQIADLTGKVADLQTQLNGALEANKALVAHVDELQAQLTESQDNSALVQAEVDLIVKAVLDKMNQQLSAKLGGAA